jgi:hypothetical protein
MPLDIPPDAVNSEEAFGAALTEVIRVARANGVEVLGGWECRTGAEADYEAVIVELSPDADD